MPHDEIFTLDEDFETKLRLPSTTSSLEDDPEIVLPNDSSDTVLELHDFADADETVKTRRNVYLEDFDVVSVIGRGFYGQVFLVRRKNTNDVFAMKVLKKAAIVLHGEKTTEHTKNERSVLEAIKHPFIVKLHYAFQCPARLYLILTYASGGELFTYLAKEKMFTDDVARFYIAELLLGLGHLHSLSIIYRDLKPENIMLDGEGHILLTDFGLSKVAINATTVCGTIEFMAPEIISGKSKYDKSVDYWSLGVMLYDMLVGSLPFTGNNRKTVSDAILKKKPIFPPYMSQKAKDLVGKLLKKHAAVRLGSKSVEDIKGHLYFKEINWNKLFKREVIPPYIPNIENILDTNNFGVEFTQTAIDGTYLGDPQTIADQNAFLGFSYCGSNH